MYLTYAVGSSTSIRRGLVIGCCFAVAMCLVFFFIGYAVSSLVPIGLASYRSVFFSVSGVLLILFGLNSLGLFEKVGVTGKIGRSLTERTNALKMGALTRFSAYNYAIGSFLFGGVISLALGPCCLSLVLPAILFTIFTAPTAFHGGLLLLMFGLGHALPVVFLSVLLAFARKAVSDRIANTSKWLKKVFGIAFLVIGIIIVVGYGFGGVLA
ncbi:sulfite exporter TauE/SafE family protein [Candidatus Bathyarchaeota archaeon]|nr:sulfite exporter TauE/SafE family protein [Candidatus Bathyarchaeota archaeon]